VIRDLNLVLLSLFKIFRMNKGKMVFGQLIEFAPWDISNMLLNGTMAITIIKDSRAGSSFYVWHLANLPTEKVFLTQLFV